jgi:hypothetical protein
MRKIRIPGTVAPCELAGKDEDPVGDAVGVVATADFLQAVHSFLPVRVLAVVTRIVERRRTFRRGPFEMFSTAYTIIALRSSTLSFSCRQNRWNRPKIT